MGPEFCIFPGQRLLDLGRGCSKPGHSLGFPALRLKKGTEDKAIISLDFSSYKLN